jgi:NADH-quinone oxidoreductase subunit J
MTALFFWIFSIGMIVCALAVVFNRNAVASALCFTFTIVFMAGLFVMLSAFFLAAVQILVTAGAVMVLFLFIIMLLDLTAMEHAPRHWIWTACSAVLALAFLGLVARTLSTMPPPKPSDAQVRLQARLFNQSQADQWDDTHEIGRMLFNTNVAGGQTSYVAPFEVTILCKQDEKPRPHRREEITREAPPVKEPEPALKS